MPEFKTDLKYISVPSDFIDTHMIKANGSFVKVYLYALYLAASGRAMEMSEIAEELNLLESDVKNAFDYWRGEGLLFYDDAAIVMSDTAASASPKKKTTAQITRIMSENKELSELCIISQTILGKPINSKDMETLYWIYDELGFSTDVISMLLEYCVLKDKRSVQYAEKVAITWNERGINTIDAAEKYMREEREKSSMFYSLRKLFGIADRPLSKREEELLNKWRNELNMSEDMVALSYEYCIMQTNKLSFPYMDKILVNWQKQGIFDIEAAEKEHKSHKSANSDKGFDVYKNDTDHNELEKLMHNKYDE